MAGYVLYERAGWGSAIVEAQLAWYGLPYRLETVDDLFVSAEARNRLAGLNPVAQVPTLVLPDGAVMTESAAITLHLADAAASDALVPGASAPERPAFLRWLVFLVANVYPTFTYADDPSRFVPAEAAPAFRRNVDAYALKLWSAVEAAAIGPHFLGQRFSALDVYLSVMTRWRPKRAWFAANAPKLSGAALTAEEVPVIREILQRNFPDALSD